MKKTYLSFLTYFALMPMLFSCADDEIIESVHQSVSSDAIIFGANLSFPEDISRSASQERLANCTLESEDKAMTLPVGIYQQEGIHAAGNTTPETRGAVISKDNITSFNVWATLTGESTSTLFFPANGVVYEQTTETNTNNQKIFKSETKYFWPGAGNLKFVAVANAPETGLIPTLNETGTEIESFTYTVPTDATKQNDIVVATPASVSGSHNQSVELGFEHIMSAVNVKIGTMPANGGSIQSMTFKNIFNTGTYSVTNKTWTRAGTKSDYSVLSEGNTEYTPGTTGSVVNNGEYTFMMLPQILADDAILEINFLHTGSSTPITLTAYIAKKDDGTYYEWGKNQTTSYVISIDENYNIQITTEGNVLDAHYIMTTATVNVTKLDANQQWYVKVSADNLTTEEEATIIFNNDAVNSYIKEGYWINSIDGNIAAVRGTNEVTGTTIGTYDVLIFIPENTTEADRKITLEYGIVGNASSDKEIPLYQKCPYWDTNKGFGWERVDDNKSGNYGFNWTRKVCYMFSYNITWSMTEEYIRSIINPLIEEFSAESYVTIDKFEHYKWSDGILGIRRGWNYSDERMAVIIDYSLLNLDNAGSPNDGLSNTKAFFTAQSLLGFEEALIDVAKPTDSSQKAFRMLDTTPKSGGTSELTSGKFKFSTYTYIDPTTGATTNAMFTELGELDNNSGILKYVIQKNAFNLVTYELDQDNVTIMLDMDANNIKWYLPAVEQFKDPVLEFATGNTTFIPANYWSSTAAEGNKAYPGEGNAIDRNQNRKIVVQRIHE